MDALNYPAYYYLALRLLALGKNARIYMILVTAYCPSALILMYVNINILCYMYVYMHNPTY